VGEVDTMEGVKETNPGGNKSVRICFSSTHVLQTKGSTAEKPVTEPKRMLRQMA
jgi:hypothetical protein